MLPAVPVSARAVALAALLALAACAAPTTPAGSAPASAAEARGAPAGGLGAALDAVDAARLAADAEHLASPELRGRGTPSPGLEAAAAYLEAGARAAGLAPGARGAYRAPYALHDASLDAARSGVELLAGPERLGLQPGSDYGVHPLEVLDRDVVAPVRFAGHGTRAELERIDVAGAWMLVWDSELSWARRAAQARRAGAVGVLVAADPEAGPGVPPAWHAPDLTRPSEPVFRLRLRKGNVEMTFFSVVTVFSNSLADRKRTSTGCWNFRPRFFSAIFT